LDRLIDKRLAERGLAPLPIDAPSAGVETASANQRSASPDDPVAASAAFLEALDGLMEDYKPSLPVAVDGTDILRCVTTEAASANEQIRKAKATLRKEIERSRQERRRKEREFYDSAYPLAFHIDLDWKTRLGKAVPPTYGCFCSEHGWHDSDESRCSFDLNDWKVRSPGRPPLFLYSNSETPPSRPPELMSRMETAGIKLPARLSCRVDDVLVDSDHQTIRCGSSVETAMKAVHTNTRH
jgi:hypothetical protein